MDKTVFSACYSQKINFGIYNQAGKIGNRYASPVEDKANIFRDVGLGEVEVANNLEDLVENARSEQVRLKALFLAATAPAHRLPAEDAKDHKLSTPPRSTMGSGQSPPERPLVAILSGPISTSKPS